MHCVYTLTQGLRTRRDDAGTAWKLPDEEAARATQNSSTLLLLLTVTDDHHLICYGVSFCSFCSLSNVFCDDHPKIPYNFTTFRMSLT